MTLFAGGDAAVLTTLHPSCSRYNSAIDQVLFCNCCLKFSCILFSFKEANSISKEELNARANIDPQQIGMLSREYA